MNKEHLNDVQAEIEAKGGDMKIRSDLMRGSIETGSESGIRVFGWPDKVYIASGVDDNRGRATVGQEFSPEAARELAHELIEAAERVESNEQEASEQETPDTSSVIKRLVGWGKTENHQNPEGSE